MTPESFAALEALCAKHEENLRAVTDQVGSLMDKVLQKGFIPVFVCNHSGLFLPGDYVKQYGRKYGIGQGPSPVSEVLDTDYEVDPPEITNQIRSIDQIMHPVGPCFAQVDLLLVNPAEYEAKKAIIDLEDQGMYKRMDIVRQKQMVNPRGRLRVMHTKWLSLGKAA